MDNLSIIHMSAERANFTMMKGLGGPFGAAIVKDGKVIAVASNTVLGSNDPTAHAEVNAIRHACRILNTYDLSGCELYATGYPCPMCMSAIIWANIKKVYFSGTPVQAARIGFRDDFIYDFIKEGCSDNEVLEIVSEDSSIAEQLYTEYEKHNKVIY